MLRSTRLALPRLTARPSVPLPRVPLRRLVALVLAAALLLAGWMALRDSSLVRVREVEIVGLSSSERAEVTRALEQAARDMTTLHVRHDALAAAVEPFASVARVRAQADFPRGLTIEVTERAPVAVVEIGGERVPVGAGGRLMRGVEPARALPVLHATRVAPGGRISDGRALDAVSALSAAPGALRRRVTRVWTGPKGLTLDLRSGPQLFFGNPSRLEAKWMATARVLSEPAARGAVYLDVRVPERVAAGGLGTVPEPPAGAAPGDPQAAPTNPQLQPEESPSLTP